LIAIRQMARAYSDDLRRKFLEAYDAGQGTLAELAEQFCVSLRWACKLSSHRNRTGHPERTPYYPGRKQSIDRQLLGELADAQPDATLAEIQQRVESRSGKYFSQSGLWRVLRQMGYRLKKSHSTPRSVTRKTTAVAAGSLWKNSAASRRRS
jgi:transposase